MHDVERQLDSVADTGRCALQELIGRTKRILLQKQKDKNKLYAPHAPEVECLAKGNARTPYEYGVKVSVVTTHKEGLVKVPARCRATHRTATRRMSLHGMRASAAQNELFRPE
jgi:IS5 family transposase